ncbi:uncharacterized protein [Heterodontus francisci]|uniref:uncharacterized protein n=1 Tax=Heterodontus francisci TaxID=7792 RepID=UPI00355C642B
MAVRTVPSVLILTMSLFNVSLSLNCYVVVGHITSLLDARFVHLFPKDYTVQLRVGSHDLKKPTLCVWTALSLLKGDWEALQLQLWTDADNRHKTEWILKGFKALNVTQDKVRLGGRLEDEECGRPPCGQASVATLVNITKRALNILDHSDCAPCQGAEPAIDPRTLTSGAPLTVASTLDRLASPVVTPETTLHSTQRLPAMLDCDQDRVKTLFRSLESANLLLSPGALAALCQMGSGAGDESLATDETALSALLAGNATLGLGDDSLELRLGAPGCPPSGHQRARAHQRTARLTRGLSLIHRGLARAHRGLPASQQIRRGLYWLRRALPLSCPHTLYLRRGHGGGGATGTGTPAPPPTPIRPGKAMLAI